MKRLLGLILAFTMLINVAVSAGMSVSNPNGEDSVRINITLPEKYEDEYVSIFVFNPGKTWMDIMSGAASDVLQYNKQSIYKDGGINFDFTVNRNLFAPDVAPKFRAVLTVKDYKEEFDFSVYSNAEKNSVLSNINSMGIGSDYLSTITDTASDVFNIKSDLYDSVTDKSGIANKLITLLDEDEITVTEDNVADVILQATLLEATESSETVLISDGEVTEQSVLKLDSAFTDAIADISDSGIASIKSAVLGKNYKTLAELKSALEENIIVNLVYNNKELGHGHVADVVSTFSTYLGGKGLNTSIYNNSSKSDVGRELIASGKKDFSAMISSINTLSASNGNTQGSVPSGSNGGSSGSSSSSSSNVLKPSSAASTHTPSVTGLIDLNEALWAKTYIEDLYKKGIVSGNGNGYFYPNNSVTRAEYTKMMVDAFGINDSGNVQFADVKADDWFYPFVVRGVGANIIFGDGTNFYPNDKIKRQDIAVIAYRVLGIFGMTLEDTGAEMTFADKDSLSEYAYTAVKLLNQYGVINGSDNFVKPLDNATRAEASVIISSVLKLYKDGAVNKTTVSSNTSSGNVEQSEVKTGDSAVSTLVRIGAVGISDTAGLTGAITKADLAGMIADYAGIKGYSNNEQRFSDVPSDNKNCADINAVTERGFMTTENGNNFEPTKTVTAGEVSRAVVSVLGYGKTISDFSDINSYHSKALELGLYDGVSATMTSYITKNDVMNIFYNSLDVPVFGYNISTNISMSEGDAYVTAFHGLLVKKGIMNGNSVTHFNTAVRPRKNTVYIQSEEFEVNDDMYYIDDCFGYYIEVYYDEDTKEIVAFKKLRNDETILIDEQIVDYADGRLYYEDGNSGKSKSITIDKRAIIVYNGEVIDNYTADQLLVKNGTMEIIEAKENTVIKIYEHDTLISNGVSVDEQTVYTKEGKVIKLDDYDSVIIRNAQDTLSDISSIESGDVLSVAEGSNSIIITFSRNSVSGNLGSVNTTEEECKLDGENYRYLQTADIDHSLIGSTVTAYLDYKGSIAYVEAGKNAKWSYGWLVKATYDEATDEVWFKYFTSDSKMLTQAQTESMKLDGIEVSGEDVVDGLKFNYDGEKESKAVPQLIKYTLASDGQFKEIDTLRIVTGGANDTLSVNRDAYSDARIYEGATNRLCESRGTYEIAYNDNNMRLDENTVIFNIPVDADISDAMDTDYEVLPLASITNRSTLKNVFAYDTDFENADLVSALVQRVSISGAADEKISPNTFFLAVSVEDVLTEQNEVVKGIYGYDYASSSFKTLTPVYGRKVFDNVAPGDVFRYNLNGRGEVSALVVDLDLGTTAFGWSYNPNHNGNNAFTSGSPGYGEAYGAFTHKNGKWINFTKNIEYVDGELKRGTMTYDMTNTFILLFNKSNNTVKEINPQDLGQYLYTVNKNATAWIYTTTGTLKACVVYI